MAPAPLIERNASPDPTDLKPPSDVIIPPKDLRSSLEKVAVYVARNGHTFEQRILDQSGGQSKFQFLIPDNPYNPYYLWRVSECKEGRTIDTSANQNGAAHGSKKKAGPEAPPEFHFSARMPNMSAVDLETVKLTALFVAKNGRPWMTALSQKEISNPNFAFLRPQHSWHSFFMRIVDQYTELLNGDIKDGGKPERERMQKMQTNVDNKYHILEDARKRAQWVKHQEAQKAKKEEEEEKEKIEFAQIDWHDFTVQATIVFDENDDQIQLPRPTSLEELQNSSLEQKAQMSLAPSNMRIEETMPGDEDFLPMGYQNQSQPQSAAPTPVQQTPMAVPPHPKQPYQSMSPAAASPYAPPPQAMPHEDEEFSRIAERQAQQQRAEAARAAASGQGPMRIRNDYVPRAQARRQNAQTAICPNCGQAIPTAEMDQHLRIEMLDPRWRDQQRIAQQRSSTTNLSTADVANNLKRLASQRSDVFDPVTGQAISKEEEERRKRVEMGSYDGTQSAQQMQQPGAGGAGQQAQPPTDVQEQIRQLHQRYGGGA